MKDLTPEQLTEVKTYLEGIRKIHGLAQERMARSEQPFDSDVEGLAYVAVTKALMDAEEVLVDEIAEKLGVDLYAENKLAEVIDLFDGNRRQARWGGLI